MTELSSLDWGLIVEKLESFATCELSRERLRHLKPLANSEEALIGFSEIGEAEVLLSGGQRPFMESLDLFKPWYQRLQRQGVLKPLELKDVRAFCLEALALKELTHEYKNYAWLGWVNKQLMEASEPLTAIDQLMTPAGEIRNDASETLFSLYREKTNQAKAIQNSLDRLIQRHDLSPLLQDQYVTTREGRWVLPIKSGMQHHFEGIIHASSQSKQTVYMEPKEVIPLNNRLRELEVEIEEEIERLLSDLSKYLFGLTEDFLRTRDALAACDYRLAQAQLSLRLSARPCTFSDEAIELSELRHPLLVLKSETVVANSVKLGRDRRILLLSGPNAGGKTVLLKAVGLAAQMARCGLPICADEGSRLPFFLNLHVGIGDSQSVDAHLSTFAAHLKILNEATEARGTKHLLLIDEICGSTDPEEGTALARSFIDTYSENQVFAVITSHLGPLKTGWKEDSGVINGSLEYNAESGRPTYQFLMGIPGQSLALQTAKRVGVDPKILERAYDNLSPTLKRYHEGLEEVETIKTELRRLTEQMSEQSKEASLAKNRYLSLVQKFERERDLMLDQTLKRAQKKVDTLFEQAKVDDTFRKFENLEKMKAQLPEIVKAPARTVTGLGKIDSSEAFARIYPPGSKVFVPSIHRDGVVQGTPNSKGEVPILSNSMRLMIAWDQLKSPNQNTNPTIDLLRRTKHFALTPADSDRQVDLRGLSVDDATSRLESELDAACLQKEERVKIVHGHGTETLKRAIRGYLSRSVYVSKWQAGTPDTGGDGITWVELKD